jgi:putative flavoprotein involved in K+ transport
MRLSERQSGSGAAPNEKGRVTRGSTTVDVLVVGAGQAGLAAARALLELDLSVIAHERHARVGDSWRQRFDSLVLFTPRAISPLPDLAHAGDPRGYPGKDEMGDYLERYAEQFRLPVVTGDGIARLSRGPIP